MAAYRWVYDSRHLQADCKEPGSALDTYARYRVRLPLPFTSVCVMVFSTVNYHARFLQPLEKLHLIGPAGNFS